MDIQQINDLIKSEIPYGGVSSKIHAVLCHELIEGNHIANVQYTTDMSTEGQHCIVLEGTDYWLNVFPSAKECVDWCKEQKFEHVRIVS